MGRGWRPILVGAAVAAGTFVLARTQMFEPSAPAAAGVAGGDVYRGELVFERECAGCHGIGGERGDSGPRLAGSGLEAADVAVRVEQGAGVMPAGLATGQDKADVVAYVVSIAGR